jgi:hypothetical protein
MELRYSKLLQRFQTILELFFIPSWSESERRYPSVPEIQWWKEIREREGIQLPE